MTVSKPIVGSAIARLVKWFVPPILYPILRPLTLFVHRMEKSLLRQVARSLRIVDDPASDNRPKASKDALIAFYDLEKCPPTFDIVNFLCHANVRREELGLKSFHVVIPPGPSDGFRDFFYQSTEEKRWRLRNIVVDSCALHPACSGVTVCSTRDEAFLYEKLGKGNLFPSDYRVAEPTAAYLWNVTFDVAGIEGSHLPSLASSSHARGIVRSWLKTRRGDRKVIVITLRESNTQSHRNSDMDEWRRFARDLDRSRYLLVVLRDSEKSFETLDKGFGDVEYLPAVLWNTELRSALYEHADINLFVSNGPIMLALFNEYVNCIVFKFIEEREQVSSSEFLLKLGFTPGTQLPFSSAFQRIAWETDKTTAITRAFESLELAIDSLMKDEFDEEFYLLTNTNAEQERQLAGDADLFAHYIRTVSETRASPTEWFDEERYREINREVDRAVEDGVLTCGFEHYLKIGKKRNLSPSP